MYLGIDIGGTKTLVACLDQAGVIQESIKFPLLKSMVIFLMNWLKLLQIYLLPNLRPVV